MSTQDWQQRWSAVMMNNYGTPPVALVDGDGAVVTDADGKTYLDLLGGIAVNALGHGDRMMAAAIANQFVTLGHTSNLYITPPGVELAERLLDKFGHPGRVMFCNSGTEANEAAFKLARLTGRPKIVAAEKAFHGRTMGALAMTGQPAKREPFEPMPAGVDFVTYGDVAELDAAVNDQTAAVILEPIMGESGVIVPPADYLAAARKITADRGALLIFDEVQTGIARTGTFFAHQAAGAGNGASGPNVTGVVPDVMTLAKGLGGGLPIGAVIALGAGSGASGPDSGLGAGSGASGPDSGLGAGSGASGPGSTAAADLFQPGMHGTTFGGNPVCTAAALAVLNRIDELDLCNHVAAVGKSIVAGIEDLAHPAIDHVRGAGLLIGIALTSDIAKETELAAREAGFLINAPAPDVLRLAPPLILTEEQGATFVAALPKLLHAAAQGANS